MASLAAIEHAGKEGAHQVEGPVDIDVLNAGGTVTPSRLIRPPSLPDDAGQRGPV